MKMYDEFMQTIWFNRKGITSIKDLFKPKIKRHIRNRLLINLT